MQPVYTWNPNPWHFEFFGVYTIRYDNVFGFTVVKNDRVCDVQESTLVLLLSECTEQFVA